MIKNYSFNLLSEKELPKILDLRNQTDVRNASFNTKIIKEEEHHQWFKRKVISNFFNHFVLKHENKIIGLGYGENYSSQKKSCLWGFYLDLKIISNIKYGSVIKYLLFEKLFHYDYIDRIECQVKKNFEWIKDWHLKWGHMEDEYSEDLNCYNLYLTKKKWIDIREKIYEKGFYKN